MADCENVRFIFKNTPPSKHKSSSVGYRLLLIPVVIVAGLLFASSNFTDLNTNLSSDSRFWGTPKTDHSRSPRRRTLPRSCECKSLFTIGACGLEQVSALKPGDSAWASAVEGLRDARRDGSVPMMPHLATFARYLPQVYSVNITHSNGTKFELTPKQNATRSLHYLPFTPCRAHVYKPREVLSCTQKHMQSTGSPFRIAFVGDSRVRNTMQQMIRAIVPVLDLKLAGEQKSLDLNLDFLESKVHINVPVQGDGLELRLHWSAFLENNRQPEDVSKQGARDLLEAWATGNASSHDGPIPDIVYVTTGLWDTSMNYEDVAVSEFLHSLKVVTPLLERLAELTTVIWHVHGPIKEWLATRDVPNTALDMMNGIAWARLERAGLWLWDTHTVMMLRQFAECRAVHEAGLSKAVPPEWGCLDFQHSGRDVEDAAANLLWNLACNRILEFDSGHCCH